MEGNKFYKAYVWTVIVTGAFVCGLSFANLPVTTLGVHTLTLAMVTILLASRIVVKFYRFNSSISVSDVLIFLALLLFGGETAILLGAAESLYSSLQVTKKPLTMLFNAAAMACSTYITVAALGLWVASVTTLMYEGFSLNLVLATAIMAGVQYLINSGLVATAAALWINQPVFATWKKHYLWTSLTYFAAASAAGITAIWISKIGFYAMIALFPIIAIVYFTYQIYQQNAEVSAAQVESENRFRQAFDNAPIGMALVALDGHWLQVNHSLCKILGFSEAQMLGTTYQGVSHTEDLDKFTAEIQQLLNGQISTLQTETRYIHQQGHEIYVLIGISLLNKDESAPSQMIFQIQDITDRKRAEEQLLYNAYHDALTGLPNRAWFVELLKATLKKAHLDKETHFAVLFLDLDRFKIINDSIGHSYGDFLLVDIAEKLKKCVRQDDQIARLGGDEFTLLIQGINGINDVIDIAERIQHEISQPFQLSGYEAFTTASIGIAIYNADYIQPEDLLRDADTAMYEAKSLGKARYAIFDKRMHEQAMNLLKLETDFRQAMERREFVVQYQPVVSLETGRLSGFEALVRWSHPEKGMISPDHFIRVAEETGLIIPLGRWVLEEACKQFKKWEQQYPTSADLVMSVNLSSKQFAHANLFDQIIQVLEITQLPPHKIKLEITESVVMDNIDVASHILERLRSHGIELSIDDFGTGYSSLSYLHRLPINILKIDRSFVSRMHVNNEYKEIVRTIILLAKNLGMEVIAEGVETQEQVNILIELHCNQGQGYFFSKPISADAAGLLLQQSFPFDKEFPFLEPTVSKDPDLPRLITYPM